MILAAELKSCVVVKDSMECSPKQVCCLWTRNVTNEPLVNNTSFNSVPKLYGQYKLMNCSKPFKTHSQDDMRTCMNLETPWCDQLTLELFTCKACCIVDELFEKHAERGSHALSEGVKVAIICSVFSLIVVVFVLYMSHRRRERHIYGVIYINNSEPFVSLLACQSPTDCTSKPNI